MQSLQESRALGLRSYTEQQVALKPSRTPTGTPTIDRGDFSHLDSTTLASVDALNMVQSHTLLTRLSQSHMLLTGLQKKRKHQSPGQTAPAKQAMHCSHCLEVTWS